MNKDINAMDLNLLKMFNAVMTQLNVSGPQLSYSCLTTCSDHALSRPRHSLKDDPVIKGPRVGAPKPKANKLSGPIDETLLAL